MSVMTDTRKIYPEALNDSSFYSKVMLWVAASFTAMFIGMNFIGPLIPISMMMPLYLVTLAVLIGSAFVRAVPFLSEILAIAIPVLMGIIIYPTIQFYIATGNADIVTMSALSTVLVVGSISVYAWFSKKSINRFAGLMFGLMIGIIGLSLMNAFFFKLDGLSLLISIAVLILFSFYVFMDIQRVRDAAHIRGARPATYALNLFIDILNIFLALLNILGRFR